MFGLILYSCFCLDHFLPCLLNFWKDTSRLYVGEISSHSNSFAFWNFFGIFTPPSSCHFYTHQFTISSGFYVSRPTCHSAGTFISRTLICWKKSCVSLACWLALPPSCSLSFPLVCVCDNQLHMRSTAPHSFSTGLVNLAHSHCSRGNENGIANAGTYCLIPAHQTPFLISHGSGNQHQLP